MPKRLLTPAEYGRHLGVSRTAVVKAIKAGRINAFSQANGDMLVDPAIADEQWLHNTSHSAALRAKSGALKKLLSGQ